MFDGKRSHRGRLLPIVVVLVAAMVGAFGSASTLATANPAAAPAGNVTSATTAALKVTHLEDGVEATAYRYMSVNWDDTVHQPRTPQYLFDTEVAKWLREQTGFKNYISTDGGPTDSFRTLNSADMRDFSDRLLAAIARGTVNVATLQVDQQTAASVGSDGSDNAQLTFHLPMGGYLIGFSNGVSRVYQPIGTYIRPRYDEATKRYQLEVENIDGTPSDTEFDAKSKEITSTKTVNTKKKTHSQIGDVLDFLVTTPIPHYPDGALNKKFGVQDHPYRGLTINPSSIRVQIEGEEAPLDPDTHYSVRAVDAGADDKRGTGFKVEFTNDQYENRLADAGRQAKKLTVTYKGTLNRDAPIKGGTHNYAQPLIPKNIYNPTVGYTDPLPRPAVTTVYTYGIRFTKADSQNENNGLKGATFKLYRGKSGNTEVSVGEKITDAGSEENAGSEGDAGSEPKAGATAGMYVVQSGPSGSATLTSGENGLLQIDGLGAGTYRLQEVKAPNGGYTLPYKPIVIEIKDEQANGDGESGDKGDQSEPAEPDGVPDSTSKIGGKTATVDSADNRLIYTFTNRKADFNLPETGAIGAVIFGVLGVALVATSVTLVVVHRRRRKGKGKRSS
ncbi:SpaH/EbpB family LPXTG-anchored major pilin [Bifidobacterium panos]|uniref:SpaA-like prealbumin fold domain-containing protein n=1 Tax=Bifidobacterium panos TaxID=2675321 RepID=A0ABX1SVY6_9BIFI|nr:SpaH/EbpB family LPXTG-anchored major pilin [Bifidobacterium sp. DSM 109963]NMN01995.1 hypothetical protein [Bifidobacterium sp. DSM 109963]